MKYGLEHIARYAEDAMEDREKAMFERALATDPALRAELENYFDVRSSLRMKLEADSAENELRITLSAMNEKHFIRKAPVVSMRKVLLRMVPAAAAAILILFIWSPWKADLYNKYSQIEMPGMAERSAGADSIAIKAEVAFNQKDYPSARGYLHAVHEQDPVNPMFTFYYGVTLMHVDSLEKSRDILAHLSEGPSIYKNDALFFLGMSYLKEKDEALARMWLNKIPADAANYDKARKVLDKMK